jgi:hypothetical protein
MFKSLVCFAIVYLFIAIECKAEDYEVFANIPKNSLGISEYRFVVALNNQYTKESIWNIFNSFIKNNSDSLIRSQLYKTSNTGYPIVPENFLKGFCFYNIKQLWLLNKYYITICVFDSTNKQLCLWTFKSTETGDILNGSKRMSQKVIDSIVKQIGEGKIEKIIKK